MTDDAATTKKPPRLAIAAALIGAATMLSRVLGLVREQLFAALLGATAAADAFNVAFRIPNLLRDLFAEGALAQAFIPTFKAKLKNEGRNAAYLLGNQVAGTLFVVIATIVLTGAIFAPQIVEIMAGDFSEIAGKFGLTVTLTRIMLPFLAIVSLAAVAMGMLNAQDKYTAPALAPAMFNVMSIAMGFGLYFAGVEGRWVAIGWAIGTLLGGMAQLGIQLPSLWRLGFRPRPRLDLRLRNEGTRRVALLMAPAVAGLAAVQVNIFVNTMFASSEEGAVSWLNYAFRFLQLPIGVFGVAIATVSTTRYADAAADAEPGTMSSHFEEGLRLVAFLTIPATVGLFVLGTPVIRLIFEHGKFGPHDTHATAIALEYFLVGLVAYAGVKVAAPAFYAMNMARIPVIASISAVAVNLIMNITLHPHYGYRILALGTAAAAIVNFGILYLSFHWRINRVQHVRLMGYVIKIAAAAAIMGGVVWATYHQLLHWLGFASLTTRAIAALVPMFVGMIVYALMCWLFRVDDLTRLAGRLKRRLAR